MEIRHAGCLCGAVRLTTRGNPDRIGLCHCMDCRKQYGAVFAALAMFPADAVTVTGKLADHQGRCFCPRCGSPVLTRNGPEIEVPLGAFDSPDQFAPSYELWAIRRESWLPDFGLRQHRRDRQD